MRIGANPVSPGIALGRALVYRTDLPTGDGPTLTPEKAVERYIQTKAACMGELEELAQGVEGDQRGIFLAHREMLDDEALNEEIVAALEAGASVPAAVRQVYGQYMDVLGQSSQAVARERADDLEDVQNRLLRRFYGVSAPNLGALSAPAILVARELLPSDTVGLDRENILAIVTETGGATSHTAILARGYGIPALVGVPGILEAVAQGDELIVDAVAGWVEINPDGETTAIYTARRKDYLAAVALDAPYLERPGETRDGVRVEIGLNIGGPDPIHGEQRRHVDFVGLMRSEFLYMEGDVLPGEVRQMEAYRRVLMTFGERPVTLRTLDVGGDKALPCLPLPEEENPFLGKRALRLCLERTDLFQTQLRAALRASTEGCLHIMFPMVGGLEDFRRARAELDRARESLDREGIPYSREIKVGAMIEIPAAALLADALAREADFASLGTNDLSQYLLAVDRGNPELEAYAQRYPSALFRLIGTVAAAFRRVDKPLSVCGELGGDPLAAPLLVGLGLRKLSMSHAAVAPVKRALAAHTLEEMEQLAEAVVQLDTEEAVRDELERWVRR